MNIYRNFATAAVLFAAMLSALCGCETGAIRSMAPKAKWHAKFRWKAEEYFKDPQVIELCRAIEANDLEKIDQLIDAGADVNARGRGNMTPLFWAFPDNQLARFTKLLARGADPNVLVQEDFGTQKNIKAGDSVTLWAAQTHFHGYFEAVMAHGGDPRIRNPESGDTVISQLIHRGGPDVKKKIKIYLDKGGDINLRNGSGTPPVIEAASWFAQFDLATYLLDLGADPRVYLENANMKLTHILLGYDGRLHLLSKQQQSDYAILKERLREMGESFEEAEADRKRWASWIGPRSEIAKKHGAEREARKAKEAAERESLGRD